MVKTQIDKSTESKILTAAKKIFTQHGMSGARMQDIADEAGINKALLHYYFRSKEKLFEMIFSEAASKIFPRLNELFEADLPLFEKIKKFAAEYIDLISENPYLPLFVLNEINRDPGTFFLKKWHLPRPEKFLNQIEDEIRKGNIRPISPLQLLVNILSMCIFPFIARPIFQQHLGLDDAQFRYFIEQRKTEIPRFIIDSIKKS
jgi:AcrR family transcriptional regulator